MAILRIECGVAVENPRPVFRFNYFGSGIHLFYQGIGAA
jgi:hypothetical protein